MATVEIEEIVREPTPPPQLLRTVVQHGEEFEMLEEGEASVEIKKLRADLTSMMGRIEVSLKRSSLSFKGRGLLIRNLNLCVLGKIEASTRKDTLEMHLILGLLCFFTLTSL